MPPKNVPDGFAVFRWMASYAPIMYAHLKLIIKLVMKAVRSSEVSVIMYPAAQRNILITYWHHPSSHRGPTKGRILSYLTIPLSLSSLWTAHPTCHWPHSWRIVSHSRLVNPVHWTPIEPRSFRARLTHPWWWRQHVPLKRRSTIILHGSTSHKTILNFILSAVRTWNLTSRNTATLRENLKSHAVQTFILKRENC
jgi:hypothetical protein